MSCALERFNDAKGSIAQCPNITLPPTIYTAVQSLQKITKKPNVQIDMQLAASIEPFECLSEICLFLCLWQTCNKTQDGATTKRAELMQQKDERLS